MTREVKSNEEQGKVAKNAKSGKYEDNWISQGHLSKNLTSSGREKVEKYDGRKRPMHRKKRSRAQQN